MYTRLFAMFLAFSGLTAMSAQTTGSPGIEIAEPEVAEDSNPVEIETWSAPEVSEPNVPEPEAGTIKVLDDADLWVVPSEYDVQAIEAQIEEDILAAEYDYREQSQRVVALQRLVGAEPDGNYGPRTREAHLEALNGRGMAVDHVPDLPAAGSYPIPNTDWGEGVEQWRPMMAEAVMAWGGTEDDVNRFMRIMHCESRGNPNAYNASSAASGLLQHLQRYWPGRAATVGMPDASPFDPWANMYVSAWLALAAPGGGWQHWVCK